MRSCYQKRNSKKLLKDKFDIKYSDLQDYSKIEELRCLNNDIKHNGVVGTELVTANNKWKSGIPISDTHPDFERLKDGPRNLLIDLKNKIEPKI